MVSNNRDFNLYEFLFGKTLKTWSESTNPSISNASQTRLFISVLTKIMESNTFPLWHTRIGLLNFCNYSLKSLRQVSIPTVCTFSLWQKSCLFTTQRSVTAVADADMAQVGKTYLLNIMSPYTYRLSVKPYGC